MHNLFGQRFVERNGYAWHGLAQARLDNDSDKTATHALRVAHADYGVVTRGLFYLGEDGTLVNSGRVAVVRPEWDGAPEAVLGVATEAYTPLQNGELCQLLDPLTNEWPVETLGALGKGETVFITLDAGTAEVGGDEIRQFFFVYNSHDGTSALKVNLTPVRVVCQNTCITGLRSASVTADVIHTRQILTEAKFAIDLVAQMRKAQQESVASLDALTRIRISYDQIKHVLASVYPEREDPRRLGQLEAAEQGAITLSDDRIAELMDLRLDTERNRRKALELRLGTFERMLVFNDERPKFAMTGWALYNAVTEVECHKEGGTNAQAGQSILVGERGARMATAYRELVALS